MDERRSEKRIDVSLETVWDGTGSKRLSARITDLSEGGCFVDTTGEAQIGERLTVRIQLPDGNSLALTGEVAHESRPIGFGLRFVDLSDEQREQLHSFLASLNEPNDPVTATFR
jgi:Tfp pilus assembly protein PilZ